MNHQAETLYKKNLRLYPASMKANRERRNKLHRSIHPKRGRQTWDEALHTHRETKDCPITDLGVMTTEDDLENFIRFGCL